MISIELDNLLKDMSLLSNKAVFFSKEEDGPIFSSFASETQKKLDIIQPTAFFVFNNQPYILFFDFTLIKDTEQEEKVHKQVWSFDCSPLIFIVKYNEIDIYNAFSYDKKKNRLQKIELDNLQRNKLFSFWNLQTGESWKWLQEEYYKTNIQKKRVNQKLFENIKLVREKLIDTSVENCLSEEEANILILRLIFIRYLIDRNVKMDAAFITGNDILQRRKSFAELIEKPQKLNEFFEQLNAKFNGVLFKNTKVPLSKFLSQSLALVFNGKENPIQPTLFEGLDFYFEIFDFSIIPVEVISGIYESLLSPETRDEHSAVYTPSFLVEYILNETIDLYLHKNKISEYKIFDPSCGSGIFLVQTYRRMVDKEIELSGDKISKVKLRQIARNNLFGLDLSEQAIKVSCFSIYIAMLDYQDPKTILDNFQFPTLIDENLFVGDFFDTDHAFNNIIKSEKFDFILGNPPWKRDKSSKHLNWVNTTSTYSKKIKGELEIAQSFLLRCKYFMQPDTIAALIVTSTIFNNISTTSKEFKKDFLTTFCLDRFFDLSPVRRLVFEEKDNPASIVYYRLSDGKEHISNTVRHLSIKSNIFLKYFKALIIEKFDQKEIQQRHFLENDWMFKVALYGNTLDFVFLKKLEKIKKKVLDLFDDSAMFKGAGIHKGIEAKYTSFLPIIGKSLIENNEVEKYYSQPSKELILKQSDSYIKSGRKASLYEGVQILIKEQAKDESEIVISLVDKSYVFRSGVFSLSSGDKNAILILYSVLISNLYEYFVFITSGSWGISTRPQIRLDDEYLAFPYIEPDDETQILLVSLIEKFQKPLEKYYSKMLRSQTRPVSNEILKKINKIINSIYEVNGHENDLIDYVLNVSRYQFQESKQNKFIKKVDSDLDFLKKYAEVFYSEFKQLYDNEYLQVQVYCLTHFIAMNFIYSKEKLQVNEEVVFINESTTEKEILKRIADNLTISKITNSKDLSKNLYIQKDIKGFEKNSFYIIKPNEYKCWHRAMAWYDIAEVRDKIEQAELTYLKGETNVK